MCHLTCLISIKDVERSLWNFPVLLLLSPSLCLVACVIGPFTGFSHSGDERSLSISCPRYLPAIHFIYTFYAPSKKLSSQRLYYPTSKSVVKASICDNLKLKLPKRQVQLRLQNEGCAADITGLQLQWQSVPPSLQYLKPEHV